MLLFLLNIKNKISQRHIVLIFAFVSIFLFIDQTSKYLMLDILKSEYSSIEILPFFNLTLVFNKGVSFSFLYGLGWQFILVLSIGALILAIILLLSIFEIVGLKEVMILSLLISGSFGNIIDRIVHKSVIDFLHVHYMGFNFPVFNIADCLISLCAIIIVFDVFINKKSRSVCKK